MFALADDVLMEDMLGSAAVLCQGLGFVWTQDGVCLDGDGRVCGRARGVCKVKSDLHKDVLRRALRLALWSYGLGLRRKKNMW